MLRHARWRYRRFLETGRCAIEARRRFARPYRERTGYASIRSSDACHYAEMPCAMARYHPKNHRGAGEKNAHGCEFCRKALRERAVERAAYALAFGRRER